MSSKAIIDIKIVTAAQSGDAGAEEQLLSRLEPVLRAFFIKRLGNKSEIDDLVQNTLIRVHRGLKDLQNPGSLKSFSMKAALFELQDLYRGRYAAKESLLDADDPLRNQVQEMEPGKKFDMEQALAVLSPKARRIVELKSYGYRYNEIAEMIGSSEAAIKMQVKRALEKMRKILLGLLVMLLWRFQTG